MSERRSQHLINRVQLVTAQVDDRTCLSKQKVNLHKGYCYTKRCLDALLSACGFLNFQVKCNDDNEFLIVV